MSPERDVALKDDLCLVFGRFACLAFVVFCFSAMSPERDVALKDDLFKRLRQCL
jgi:hypothetical protein